MYLCLISESRSHDNVDEVLVGEPGAVADVVHVVVAYRPARGCAGQLWWKGRLILKMGF